VGVKRGEIFDETVKAKEELEEKYRHLLTTINEWVWEIDANGCFTMCSPQIMDLLGYRPEDVLGKPLKQFLSNDDSPNMKKMFTQSEQPMTAVCTIQSMYNHKDGQVVSLLSCITPIKDTTGKCIGYRGIQKTVPSFEESEGTKKLPPASPVQKKKLVPKKKQIHQTPEAVDMDALLLCDEQSHIIDCTDAVNTLLGYTRDELLSFTLKDFDMLETLESIKDKLREAKKHGSVLMKTIHKRKDGSSLLVKAQIDYLRDKNLYQCLITEEHQKKNAV